MGKQVNHLGVPPMDLTITKNERGNLEVQLNVPVSSGSKDNIPFLEVTRNERDTLLNGARQELISRLSQSGFTIGDIEYKAGGSQTQGGNAGLTGKVPGVGKASFEITSETKLEGSVGTILKNNPDIAGAIRETEKNFDTRRQDIYEQRAREWHRDGGATLESYNPKTKQMEEYNVTKDAAKTYINERYPHKIWKRVSAEDGGMDIADASSAPTMGNEPVNKQFQQALKGTNGDKDAAAVALETIKNNPSYKENQDISVVQGKNGGFIVSQGQGDSAVNLAVQPAKQGDFDRVATQLAQPQQSQQVAVQPEPLERKGPTMA